MNVHGRPNTESKGKQDEPEERVFNPQIDYNVYLTKLKEEFDQKWTTMKPSPATGLDGYQELAVLGAGSFGRVILVKRYGTDVYFAVKMLSKEQIVKTKQTTHLFNEKRVLHSIDFPFAVHLIFSTKDNDNIFFSLPFINGGELFTYLRRVRKFAEKQGRFYAAQVFLALEYLHSLNLLYRDLKPENILIDYKGYLKLTDFGFAKKVETRTMTLCGTPEYLAPEIISSKPYGVSVDWWAFGVLIYEFAAGCSPFAAHNRDVMKMYTKICEGEYKMPTSFSGALRDLVTKLLQTDVTKRLGNMVHGNKEIKKHEWFRTVNWYAILNQEINPPYVPIIANIMDLTNFDNFPALKPRVHSPNNRYETEFADF